MVKKIRLLIVALLAMPLTVSAHEGHLNTVIHAAMHWLEEDVFFLVLVVMAALAGLALRQQNRQSKTQAKRHDSR
jgi:putative exporter of polyketide antibiotics